MSGDGQFLVGSLDGAPESMEEESGVDPFDEMKDEKPKIVLMGLGNSGKSSIKKVVFHKMSPNETWFIESTVKPSREDVSTSSFIDLSIFEIPGQINIHEKLFEQKKTAIFTGTSKLAVIFVIDAVALSSDYGAVVKFLKHNIVEIQKLNGSVHYEIFIHKVDFLSDDKKLEEQDRISHLLHDEVPNYEELVINYSLTSIYDHSIFEAFSKVVQKLIDELPALEQLLNSFVQASELERSFLCDVVSKIYVATDNSAHSIQAYELSCDMIDLAVDLTSVYARPKSSKSSERPHEHSDPDDERSSASIWLNNNTILYLKAINRYLVLVSVGRTEAFEKHGIIDHNFNVIKHSINKVLELRRRRVKGEFGDI